MIAVVFNACAWLGSACVLYAYARQEKTAHYQSLNIVGSIGLGAQCAYHGLYAQLLTNSLWTLVGLRSLMTSRETDRVEGGLALDDAPPVAQTQREVETETTRRP